MQEPILLADAVSNMYERDKEFKEEMARIKEELLVNYAVKKAVSNVKITDEEVRAMAARIRETGVELVCTGHCTGDRAVEILREELGEKLMEFYSGFEINVGAIP